MTATFTKNTLASLMALGLMAAAPAISFAQEIVLHGPDWGKSSPGSEVTGNTQINSVQNRSTARITASGGKVSALAGMAVNVSVPSSVHANSVGLSAVSMDNTQVNVLGNQVQGSINSIGGSASANSVLISGGGGRRPVSNSRIDILDNTAQNVDAYGGQASVAAGAIVSGQMPGRALANSLLTDQTDIRQLNYLNKSNQARDLSSVGGSALVNAMTVSRGNIERLDVTQTDNVGRNVQSGGGSAALGAGVAAKADLTGVSAANSVLMSGSQVRASRVDHQGNNADGMQSLGGAALANSVNVADQQGALNQYQATLRDNRAQDVIANGGDGSLLLGTLADLKTSALALANSIFMQRSSVDSGTQHTVTGNRRADTIQATGGAAAANSIWIQDSTVRRSNVTVNGNAASDISTSGGSARVVGGLVGDFERNGRAVANSLALDANATLDNAPVTLDGNQASNVRGFGGVAAANGALLSNATVRNGRIDLNRNTASGVSVTGFKGSAGGGFLFSITQNAVALVNSLGVFGSTVDAPSVNLAGNTAQELSAQGGTVVANSVSVEDGESKASRLSAATQVSNNTVTNMSTGASDTAGPAKVFSESSKARAAANSVVLHDDATVDSGSPLTVTGNQGNQIAAIGGTALVNTLAGYRGARISGSPVTLTGNTADNVSTGGQYGQVASVGSKKNGILVANGVYLEGQDSVHLSNSPLTIHGNNASQLNADGGRINANALAINGKGNVQGSQIMLSGNSAESVSSEGTETTVAGHAVMDRGVGNANANAVQVLGDLLASGLSLVGNIAKQVSAQKGMALANSVVVDEGASADGTPITVTGNTASNVSAGDGKTAAANSVVNEGRLSSSTVSIVSNIDSGAQAEGKDASAASVRNRKGGQISGSQLVIMGNRGNAHKGTINSIDNSGSISNSRIVILGNQGGVQNGGMANSVHNDGGTITGGQITIMGNNGTAQNGGTVNSVVNQGRINQGSSILIASNTGSAQDGGMVNSVHNQKQGVITGSVTIMGNRGSAAHGGVSNSVINNGVISGKVAIVGNNTSAGVNSTSGSVRTLVGGSIADAAGVTANRAWINNVGYTTVAGTPVLNRTVTVGPATAVTAE